jgi:hypothetical protein
LVFFPQLLVRLRSADLVLAEKSRLRGSWFFFIETVLFAPLNFEILLALFFAAI